MIGKSHDDDVVAHEEIESDCFGFSLDFLPPPPPPLLLELLVMLAFKIFASSFVIDSRVVMLDEVVEVEDDDEGRFDRRFFCEFKADFKVFDSESSIGLSCDFDFVVPR
jgi:hypothetical protein